MRRTSLPSLGTLLMALSCGMGTLAAHAEAPNPGNHSACARLMNNADFKLILNASPTSGNAEFIWQHYLLLKPVLNQEKITQGEELKDAVTRFYERRDRLVKKGQTVNCTSGDLILGGSSISTLRSCNDERLNAYLDRIEMNLRASTCSRIMGISVSEKLSRYPLSGKLGYTDELNDLMPENHSIILEFQATESRIDAFKMSLSKYLLTREYSELRDFRQSELAKLSKDLQVLCSGSNSCNSDIQTKLQSWLASHQEYYLGNGSQDSVVDIHEIQEALDEVVGRARTDFIRHLVVVELDRLRYLSYLMAESQVLHEISDEMKASFDKNFSDQPNSFLQDIQSAFLPARKTVNHSSERDLP
ncbi:MAG: hypothetical protein H7222_09715 [Methylotenera sp.]|nr:hypothetical protein [Oligoflexia bacterium]